MSEAGALQLLGELLAKPGVDLAQVPGVWRALLSSFAERLPAAKPARRRRAKPRPMVQAVPVAVMAAPPELALQTTPPPQADHALCEAASAEACGVLELPAREAERPELDGVGVRDRAGRDVRPDVGRAAVVRVELSSCQLCLRRGRWSGLYCGEACELRAAVPAGHQPRKYAKSYTSR